MKVGICGSLEQIRMAEELGFDYIEPALAPIAALSDEEFKRAEELAAGSGIRCEVFNVLFPPNISLTGPNADEGIISGYLDKAFDRVSSLGGEIVVFGSGGARRIPVGYSPDKAYEQLVRAAAIAGDAASRRGIVIAMEPLSRAETNTINSVSEGIEFVRRVNHTSVRLLADFYHMRAENEQISAIEKAAGLLVHTHIANSHGRVFPSVISEDEYLSFFRALKAIGYKGRVSVEAGTEDIDKDGPAALRLLRELIQIVQNA